MADGKIRVKFEADGSPALIAAIKALNKETKRLASANTVLTKETKKTNKQQKEQEQRTRNLTGTFSVLRSKMLLAAFAIKQFADPFVNLARNSVMVAANFEALETRLVSMTGSVSTAAQMMAEFRDIAATTPFAVQDVVEAGVQLRAFGVNAQEMIKPVTDLAAFMGTTATEAASALGRAFAGGAGAADILRERGILQLIKDSQGIEDLSKTTLPEFREALENAMIDPVAGIAGATDKLSKTTVGAFSNMKDALDELQVTFATVSGLKDWMTEMAVSTKELANSIDSGTIERITKIAKLIIDLNNFRQTIGLIGGDLEDFPKRIKELWEKPITVASEAQQKLIEKQKIYRKTLEETKNAILSANPTYIQLREQLDNQFQAFDINGVVLSKNITWTDALKLAIKELSENYPVLIERVDTSISVFDKVAIKTVEQADAITNLRHQIKLYANDTIQASNAAGRLGSAITELAGDNRDTAIFGMRLSAGAAIASGIAGAAKAFEKGGPLGYIAGTAMLAETMVRVNTINSQIRTLQAEKFETGGLVGGRRHSQGGTMIEAERGEFVMSRNAVSAIGVENLNRMNQGQSGGGGINISIKGGMISPDFVENELAESIREAVRRGADFGIS